VRGILKQLRQIPNTTNTLKAEPVTGRGVLKQLRQTPATTNTLNLKRLQGGEQLLKKETGRHQAP